MIRFCIFDIGGTLVRTDEALVEAIKMALEKNHLQAPPDEEIAQSFGTGNFNNIATAVGRVYAAPDMDDVIERCCSSFGDIFPERVFDKLSAIPKVVDTLTRLSQMRVKLAVQTDFRRREAEPILGRFGLLSFFPVCVTLDDVREPRPDPAAMYETMRLLGTIAKDECLYVGDTVADVRFAQNAGIEMICVTTGVQRKERLKQEHPDHLIDSLDKLVDIIIQGRG